MCLLIPHSSCLPDRPHGGGWLVGQGLHSCWWVNGVGRSVYMCR